MPAEWTKEPASAQGGATALDRFLAIASLHPERPALRARRRGAPETWERWTMGDYANLVAATAAGLVAGGVQRGERLALMLGDVPEAHWLELAAQFVGALPVRLAHPAAAATWRDILDDAQPEVVVVGDDAMLATFLAARPGPRPARAVFVVDPPQGLLSPGVAPVSDLYRHGVADLAALAAQLGADDLASLSYTAGTTGAPRGVLSSHGNLLAAAQAALDTVGDVTGWRAVSTSPIAQPSAWLINHWVGALGGMEVTCHGDGATLVEDLRATQPHLVVASPRQWRELRRDITRGLSRTPERLAMFDESVRQGRVLAAAQRAGQATPAQQSLWAQLDATAFAGARAAIGLDQARVAVSTGDGVDPSLPEWFGAIGVNLSELYGSAETTGIVAWSPATARPGTIGHPVPGVEVTTGTAGELWSRGGNVFVGYAGSPEATAAAMAEGWYRTGDLVEVDPDGSLRLRGRLGDAFTLSDGVRVDPAAGALALSTLDVVAQGAVFGAGHSFATAIVALDPEATLAWGASHGRPTASLAELAQDPDLLGRMVLDVAAVNRALPRPARIKAFTVVGEPWAPGSELLTAIGGVRRAGVAATYQADLDALYADEDLAERPIPMTAGGGALAAPTPPAPSAPPVPTPPAPLAPVVPSDSLWNSEAEPELIDPTPSWSAVLRPTRPLMPKDPAAPARRGRPGSPVERDDTDATPSDDDTDRFAGLGRIDDSMELDPHWAPEPAIKRWWWAVLVALVLIALAGVVVTALHRSHSGSSNPAAPAPADSSALTDSTLPDTAPATSVGDTTPQPNTLLSAVERTPSLTTFLTALNAAGLGSDLEGTGPYTIFAPTDDAFAKIPASELSALLADKAALTTVLRHHIVAGTYNATDLTTGTLTALDGTPITVSTGPTLTLNGVAQLVDTDLVADNGVLHTVDTVLLPPGFDLSNLPSTPSGSSAPTDSTTPGSSNHFIAGFQSGSSLLTTAGKATIKDAAAAIKALPAGTTVTVTGVSDDRGLLSKDTALAHRRATVVIQALKAAGATAATYAVQTTIESYSLSAPEASWRADIVIGS